MSQQHRLDETAIGGGVEVACYRTMKPGKKFLLWYSDDHVWHEALCGLVVGGVSVVMLTPDDDLYIEDISCRGVDGPIKIRSMGPNNTIPSGLRGRVYRFRERITDDLIKSTLRRSLSLAETELGESFENPPAVYNARGEEVDVNDFFGGSFVRRRQTVVKAGESATPTRLHPKNAVAVTPALGDHVWVAAEPLGGLTLGQEVSLSLENDVQVGDRTALTLRAGQWVKVEMISVQDAVEFANKRRELFAYANVSGSGECPADLPRAKAEAAPKKGDEGDEDGEVRTLWVDFDEHGERFKRWRDVCRECFTASFEEKPVEGPMTALHLIKHAERHGGDPRLWMQLWLRAKRLEGTDRTYHELKTLVDVLYFAGCYDQLNIPSLISMEVVCRRIQAILDAYANPAKPSWENAKIFTGQGTPEDIVSPTFRSYATKKNKDELELLQARQKVRELRGGYASSLDDSAGDTMDALPSKPPAKGPKKGRGRGGQGQDES